MEFPQILTTEYSRCERKETKKITSYGAIQKGVIYWVTQNYWQEANIRANYFNLLYEESFGMQRLAETVSNAMQEREPALPVRTVRMRIAMWMLDPDYDGRSLFPR